MSKRRTWTVLRAQNYLIRATILVLGLVGTSHAQETASENERRDFYIRGNIGLASTGNIEADTAGVFDVFPLNPGVTSIDIDRQAGFTAGGAFGYDIASPFAIETEYRFIRNGIDQIDPLSVNGSDPDDLPPTAEDVGGAIRAHVILLNFNYDFEEIGRFRPIVGAGIGAANVSSSGEIGFLDPTSANDWVFAFQARVGFGYEIRPGIRVGADYSFVGSGSTSFDTGILTADGGDLGDIDVDGLRNGTVSFFVEKRF